MNSPSNDSFNPIDIKCNSQSISKDMLLDLLRETRKSSKELLEVGKQFCEWLKSR